MATEIDKVLKHTHSGNLSHIQLFHEDHPNIHWTDIRYRNNGDTILHVASRLGHVHILKYILEHYHPIRIDFRNTDNKTALHEAAQFAQLESVRVLLQYGADVNALKKADWTPLMLACTKVQPQSLSVVELLIKSGAMVNIANKDGWTALHITSREGSLDILKLLLLHDVDVEARTKNKRTAQHIAALHGNWDLLQCIMGDPNVQDTCGNTLVHEAALSGDLCMFRAIINMGGNFSALNKSGLTVLHLAAGVGALEVIEEIVNVLKLDVNAKSYAGITALECALKSHNVEAAKFLLKYGAENS